MPEESPMETRGSLYSLARPQSGSRPAITTHVNNVNLVLGLVGGILGIVVAVLTIIEMLRPDLFKKLLDRLFPGLEH